ncbi:MAG: hypothetical protein HY053_02140 [Proteobacteria bacterium]|nr:hypothetical protein [Pseudomonadota bacterium]
MRKGFLFLLGLGFLAFAPLSGFAGDQMFPPENLAGWEPFTPADGRTLVGCGSGPRILDGGPGPAGCSQGEQGGENFVTLTVEQMPKHSHNIRLTGGPDDHDFNALWTFDIRHLGYAEFDWTGYSPDQIPGTNRLRGTSPDGITPEGTRSLIAANGDGLGPFLSASSEGGSQPFDNRQAFVGVLFCKKSVLPPCLGGCPPPQ